MDEYDPRLVVTLKADNPRAEIAWNRPENRDRCQSAPETDGELVEIPSRGTTPAVSEQGEPQASKIHLTFDQKPKNLEKGFVFGSDPQTCDVLLGAWAGISRQHFRITFNARGEVILVDTSRFDTNVSYNGEKLPNRNQFTWILFDRYHNIKVTLNKEKENESIFQVEWPENRQFCFAQYEAHRDTYLEECRNATPSLSRLGMDSQQSQHRQPIYLPEEELGRGNFGKVNKIVNVSTGDEHAGKKFHGGNWKKEVEILRKVSHKHIADFVDFTEEQEPLLVMEYLPLGNLACQGYITEEETLRILCQGLQALKYLHSQSPPLAHRDIKPDNILVRSRTPFVIKLVDFGLAKNDSSLKTFCGTNEYAAPEIWEHGHYTAMVDIWSLGVVVLQYGYGLPKPSRKRKGKPWCQDLVQFAEDSEGQGDALIDLISTKMLRMDYRDRRSASDCLVEVYRLGFHDIQTECIGRTTPTGKTTGRKGVTRTKSLRRHTRQNAPLDSDVSSGFYNVAGASETTEVAPSKRDLREGVHFYNRASLLSLDRHPQEPTQIRNRQSEDKATSTLSKKRRPQATRSPAADAVERGQSKRSRASVSCEAGEQPSKASNSRQGPEQLERSVVSNREGPLTIDIASLTQDIEPIPQVAPKVSLKETEKPSSTRNMQDYVKAILVGDLDDEDEGKAKVTDFNERHVQIKSEDNIVLMRKDNCFLNATQILTLANKDSNERRYILEIMKKRTKVEVLPPAAGIRRKSSWVNFHHGQILCKHLGLEQELKPLIEYGLKVQRNSYSNPPEQDHDYISEEFPPYFTINVLPHPVAIRKLDLRVNVDHICRASCQPRDEMLRIREQYSKGFDIVLDAKYHPGTYVDLWIGVELCRKYGLAELEERLRILQEPATEPKLSVFIDIAGLPKPVMVRRSDLRINASHLAKLAGHSRSKLADFRDTLSSEAYDILRGNPRTQGTYVDFDLGIELCRKYQISELEKRLYSLKRRLEGPALEVEPSHVGPWSQTFRQLPESPGSDRVSARNESTQSRRILDRDRPVTSSGGPIANRPMQAEGTHGMDSRLDRASSKGSNSEGSDSEGSDSEDSDSEGSYTPRKACSMQRKPPPLRSMHIAKDAASSRQSGRDSRYPLCELASPHSNPAKSVQYEVWILSLSSRN